MYIIKARVPTSEQAGQGVKRPVLGTVLHPVVIEIAGLKFPHFKYFSSVLD